MTFDQEILKGLKKAAEGGFHPSLRDGSLTIPGWGFELVLYTGLDGESHWYINDTSGG